VSEDFEVDIEDKRRKYGLCMIKNVIKWQKTNQTGISDKKLSYRRETACQLCLSV